MPTAGQAYATARKKAAHGYQVSEGELLTLRFAAFGKGPIPTGKAASAAGNAQAKFKDAHCFNSIGDVRCPSCHRVNHKTKGSMHPCEHCGQNMNVIPFNPRVD